MWAFANLGMPYDEDHHSLETAMQARDTLDPNLEP